MKKNEIIDLRFLSGTVRHVERTECKCILFCASGNRGHAELVLEKVEASKDAELLGNSRIQFVKEEPTWKDGPKCYTFFYQGTERTTVIFAESLGLYRSGYFIGAVGRYAAEEWNKRHICLPSLMTSILMLETDHAGRTAGERIAGGKTIGDRTVGERTASEIQELVKEHTDYLAMWKEEGMQEENWKSLWGQGNYILAAQYLQEAGRPYFQDKQSEKLLVQTIEENELTRFDF